MCVCVCVACTLATVMGSIWNSEKKFAGVGSFLPPRVS